MAQNPPLLCPTCNTPAQSNQRFCAECGTTLNVGANKPTALASESQFAQAIPPGQNNSSQQATERAPQPDSAPPAAPISTPPTPQPGNVPGPAPYRFGSTNSTVPTSGSQFYSGATDANVIPPPPPPESFVSARQQSPTPVPGTYVVPDYARVPKRSRGLLIITIVLLLVLALGGIGIYALTHRGTQTGNTGTQTTPGTGSTPGSGTTPGATQTSGSGTTPTPGGNGSTPTGNGATNEPLNLMFTFASVNMTITSVQYANSFPDDSSATSGTVRINFKEANSTSGGSSVYYPDVTRLKLPDGTLIAPLNEENSSSPQPQVSDTNWIDFTVPAPPADLSKLILQMGTLNDNQMLIPLSPGADLSQYQPKTVTPNLKFQYAGLDWTISNATEGLNENGNQATKGNVYIVLTLMAFNPTTSDFSAYYGDYIRLKAGDTTNSPTGDTNFPSTVSAQTTQMGTVVFLVPQGNTGFTLMMLAQQTSPPISAVSQNFQIS